METSLNLAFRYLKSQKRRNLLTVFSVSMAVALFAASGILISSFQNMVKESHIQTKGDWHYRIYTPAGSEKKIALESARKVSNNFLVEQGGVAAEDKYLKVGLKEDKVIKEPTANDYNFYRLKEYDSVTLSMFPYERRIIEGRMPENESELIISNGSSAFWKDSNPLGKEVTFEIGTGEEFVDEQYTNFDFNQKGWATFKIVGIYDRFRFSSIPNISEAVTINPTGDHAYSIYVKVKPVVNYINSIDQIMKDLTFDKYAVYETNDSFLRWIGQGNDNIRFMFMAVFGILCTIILIAMIMVIKNAFALSYSEKIAQFGILRCIGATRKQISNIVLAEGIVIWAIAQPFGILLAMLAMHFVVLVVRGIELDMLRNLELQKSYWPIIFAMASSLVTILVSAGLSAKKTSEISPVQAVKGNIVFDAYGGKPNIVERISERIFGFSWSLASRNIKRNRGRYRATLVSVIVSVVLFISVVGLSIGLNHSLNNYSGGYTADFFFNSNHHSDKSKESYTDILNDLEKINEIEYAQKVYPLVYMLDVPTNRIPEDYEDKFRRYYSFDSPYTHDPKYLELGENLKEVKIIPVSRNNYASLKFKGTAPEYDDLLQKGEVLISQVQTFRKNGSMSVVNFSNFVKGEELSIGRKYGEGLADLRKVKVAGELSETPWYAESRSQGYLVVPEENIDTYLSNLENARYSLYKSGYVAIKAKEGKAESLNFKLEKVAKSSFGPYNGFLFNSPYQKTKELRDIVLVMNIFIYGFITVIIIICSLNIFSTIATNLANRKREITMLRSVGMSTMQLRKNLFLECTIYSINGTIYGGIIGIASLFLLTHVTNKFFAMDFQNPLIYLFLALVFSTVIAIVAGIGPVNKMLKYNLADSLREVE